MPHTDAETGRARRRERARSRNANFIARGICTRCGENQAAPANGAASVADTAGFDDDSIPF